MSQAAGARILVVDDEPAILRAVRTILVRHGFQVETAESGRQAIEQHAYHHPDVILLDLGLPDMDGLDVLREVRTRSNTPIVVLSVRGAERDKVEALELGADDYLTKPFGIDELLARIRVALRHALGPAGGTQAVFRTGDLEVDIEHRRVRVAGRDVHLTPTEYELLKTFITHPNKVLTDRMLLQEVWGPEYGSEGHYLHVYVARLRKKLETSPQAPRYLITEPGVGYRLLTQES
ncbi:MAG TPA: response regulator transcription factor [Dehalococcoidia bacterium]|nr:response regulator transcription factor [Dehalococcoidia bacterium]